MQRSASLFRGLVRARSFSSSSKAWFVGPSTFRSLRLANQAERCLRSASVNRPRRLYEFKKPCRFYSSGDLPAHYKITLPALSPTMEAGTVVRWEKQVGDRLMEGDLLCEIETDKATMGFETSEEGFLAKIFVEEGAKDVPVGRLLCIIVEEESGVDAFKDFEDLGIIEAPPSPPGPVQDSIPPAAPPPPRPSAQPRPTAQPPTPLPQPPLAPARMAGAAPPLAGGPKGRVFASPLARKLASERGIDLGLVQGTGPGGRIIKADIDSFVPGVAVAMPTAPGGVFTDIPVDALRLDQANAAVYSKQTIPHYYLMADIDVGSVLRLQDNLNQMVTDGNTITLNEWIVKAASLACIKIPDANSAWFGDKIRQYHNVDVNIAVTTDFGTINPVIHAANTKGLEALRQEVNYVTSMAQEGQMQAQVGTFSISNYSEFGVRGVAGVIPSPQACHLGVGAVQDRYVPDEDAEEGYRAASVVTVTLVCDHRVVDGAVGAQWLQQFKKYLEQPVSMLL